MKFCIFLHQFTFWFLIIVKQKNHGRLNFQRIHDFNWALLEKQVWHFLKNSSSLVLTYIKPNIFLNVNQLFVSSPIILGLKNLTVKDLIHQSTHQWNWTFINNIFSRQDIILIGRIPLSSPSSEDTSHCFVEKNGFYYIRSAYKLSQEFITNRQPDPF